MSIIMPDVKMSIIMKILIIFLLLQKLCYSYNPFEFKNVSEIYNSRYKNCTQNEIEKMKCFKNQGTCLARVDTIERNAFCLCTSAYRGSKCQYKTINEIYHTMYDTCTNNEKDKLKCLSNRGTCVARVVGTIERIIFCRCFSKFGGARCENSMFYYELKDATTSIVLLFVTTLLFVCFCIIFIYIIYTDKKIKKKHIDREVILNEK